MSAELCPVCSGSGRVYSPLPTSTAPPTEVCHGCGGKGWVETKGSCEKVEMEDVLSVPEIYDNDGNLCNCGICAPTSEGK